MARPALSATRATAVLDLLAAFPDRAFTMAEVIRATGINIASCHALLNALTARGYLTRIEGEKEYRLGPALVTVGEAALKANGLVARAREAAEDLSRRLDVGVLLSTVAGGDILALTVCEASDGNSPGMRPGQRFPLVAPAGAHFVAWASETGIDEWIAAAGESTIEEIVSWRRALALVKERGYQVTLRVPLSAAFGELMAEMATGTPSLDFRARADRLIEEHAWHLDQPETIEADALYDVALIASPVFNRAGAAVLSLGIGGFSGRITGARIKDYAAELIRTCLRVMREDRSE